MGHTIIVDGANVAHEEQSKRGKPKVANLLAVRRKLHDLGYDPVIIVDAHLRHTIDDADQFEKLEDDGVLRQAPAGTEADYFIVRLAEDLDAKIVSNDQFEPYHDRFPRVTDRRVPLMIVDGTVIMHRLEPAEG